MLCTFMLKLLLHSNYMSSTCEEGLWCCRTADVDNPVIDVLYKLYLDVGWRRCAILTRNSTVPCGSFHWGVIMASVKHSSQLQLQNVFFDGSKHNPCCFVFCWGTSPSGLIVFKWDHIDVRWKWVGRQSLITQWVVLWRPTSNPLPLYLYHDLKSFQWERWRKGDLCPSQDTCASTLARTHGKWANVEVGMKSTVVSHGK